MSAGGVFQLIANKGKSDSLLLATNLLNQRLKQCACNRKAQGLDPTPVLADIEKTHVLFVNAHFKPFAAIGFEYNKVKPQSGSATYGGSVTFSIPQFGDFFGDMVCRADLPSATASTETTATSGQYTAAGIPTANGGYTRLVKYCDYPAERLFTKVKFDVNGNPLDEYRDVTCAMLRKFTVAPGKKAGYNRLTGQENPIVAQTGNLREAPTTNTAADAGAREQRMILNGLQTPKGTHAAVSVWHKLRFWFNEDVRLAVPSVSIPYGQRFITMDIASKGAMMEELNNLYTLDVDTNDNPVWSAVSNTLSASAANISLGNSNLTLELYVNNIFVNPEVHDIFIKRIGFSLIRVYRYHTASADTTSAGEMLMSSLKWPIEYIWVGFRVATYATAAGRAQKWHRFNKLTDVASRGSIVAQAGATGSTVVQRPTEGGAVGIQYMTSAPMVDNLTVKAHGITLFDNFERAFYNSYIPFTYGGTALQTPDQDDGVMMINFALYPCSAYQPSGHLNVSRAREFYISWPAVSGSTNGSATAQLHAVAKALNFLLITDGSAVLRYST